MLLFLVVFLGCLVYQLSKKLKNGDCTVQTYERMLEAEYKMKVKDQLLCIEFLEMVKKNIKEK